MPRVYGLLPGCVRARARARARVYVYVCEKEREERCEDHTVCLAREGGEVGGIPFRTGLSPKAVLHDTL